MVCWFTTIAILTALCVLRRRLLRAGRRQPACASCGYDLHGLDQRACCPECGGGLRVRPSARVVWQLRPRWANARLCVLALAVAPAVYRGATITGGTLRYWHVEPVAAAFHNASTGWQESLVVPAWMPWLGFTVALATVWWRGAAAWWWLLIGLSAVAAEGALSGYSDPGVHRGWYSGGADDVPSMGMAAVCAASLLARGIANLMRHWRVEGKQPRT